MNARTALNISLDETLRKVELRTGGIIAEVVDDQRLVPTTATHAGRIFAQEASFPCSAGIERYSFGRPERGGKS
ncbi:hypothetical protein WDV93_01590 [Pantoea ananatis]